MYEVELKLRADHEAVRAALDDAGASAEVRVRQVDTYYDAPHRDFAETDEALRLRRETREPVDGPSAEGNPARSGPADGSSAEGSPAQSGPADGPSGDGQPTATTELTYKGPLIEAASKTREERETTVADGDAAAAILDGLGFEPAATVKKDRTFFAVEGYTVSLDRVDGLGAFVEIEAEAAASEDVADVREGAKPVLRDLGLDPDDQIRTSYLGLLLDGTE